MKLGSNHETGFLFRSASHCRNCLHCPGSDICSNWFTPYSSTASGILCIPVSEARVIPESRRTPGLGSFFQMTLGSFLQNPEVGFRFFEGCWLSFFQIVKLGFVFSNGLNPPNLAYDTIRRTYGVPRSRPEKLGSFFKKTPPLSRQLVSVRIGDVRTNFGSVSTISPADCTNHRR